MRNTILNLPGQSHYLVIDGGGSKVAAALVRCRSLANDQRQSEILLQAHLDGSGSATAPAWPMSLENIAAATEQVLSSANLPANSIELTVVALAGAGRSEDQLRVSTAIADHPQLGLLPRVEVISDIAPLIAFAEYQSPTAANVVTIVGTGSIVVAQLDGSLIRSGGWGPVLGDEGSGWAIAKQALRAVCKWIDGEPNAPATPLVKLVDRFLFDSPQRNEDPSLIRERLPPRLIRIAGERRQAARLAGGVLKLADSGDREAESIARGQASQLAGQIEAIVRRATATNPDWQLWFAGGLARHHAGYRSQILDAIDQQQIRQPRLVQLIDPLEALANYAVAKSTSLRYDGQSRPT